MPISFQHLVYMGSPKPSSADWAASQFLLTRASGHYIRQNRNAYQHNPNWKELTALPRPNNDIILAKINVADHSFDPYYLPVHIKRSPHTLFNCVQEVGVRTLEDGTLTQLPDACLEALEVVITVQELSDGCWTYSQRFEEGVSSGSVGGICLLEGDAADRVKQAIETVGQRKFKTIKFKGFHRSGQSVPEFVEQTKKQIFSGSKFFLLKHTVLILNQETMEFMPKAMISLGIFCSNEKMNRYTGSRNTLQNLKEDLIGEGLRLFNPAEFARKVRERTGALTKYFPGIAEKIVAAGENMPSTFYDILETVDSHHAKPTNRELLALSSRASINNSDVGKKYLRSRDAHARIVKQVTKIRNDIDALHRNNSTNVNRRTQLLGDIESYQRCIDSWQELITSIDTASEGYSENVRKQTVQLNIIEPAITSLSLQAQRDEAVYKREMISLIENPPEGAPNLVERYRNTGFIIKEIRYQKKDGTQTKSLHEDPLMPQSHEWFCSYISLVTSKPTIIYVDRGTAGEKAKKVVAGPYEIEVTVGSPSSNPSVRLRLASVHSVFGIRKDTRNKYDMTARIHPHCGNITLKPSMQSLENLAKTWRSVCLGDAQATLGKGFRDQDPRVVIMGLLAWLSNANSRDTWGATHTWFPKVHEVDLDGRYGQDPDADEEPAVESGMTNTLQELAERLAQHQPTQGNS